MHIIYTLFFQTHFQFSGVLHQENWLYIRNLYCYALMIMMDSSPGKMEASDAECLQTKYTHTQGMGPHAIISVDWMSHDAVVPRGTRGWPVRDQRRTVVGELTLQYGTSISLGTFYAHRTLGNQLSFW